MTGIVTYIHARNPYQMRYLVRKRYNFYQIQKFRKKLVKIWETGKKIQRAKNPLGVKKYKSVRFFYLAEFTAQTNYLILQLKNERDRE